MEVASKLSQGYKNLQDVTIRDLAEALSVSESTIRGWEDRLEIEIPRNCKKHRRYPQRLVKLFEIVKQLVESNHSFEEVKILVHTEYVSYLDSSNDLQEDYIYSQQIHANNQQNHAETFVIHEQKSDDEKKFEMIIAPYKAQIDSSNKRIDNLLDKIERLQDEKNQIKEQNLMEKAEFLENFYNKIEEEKNKVKEQVLEESINKQNKANQEHRKEKEKILAEKAQEISELQAELKKYKELQENKKERKGFFNNIWKVLNTEVTRIKK